VLEVGFTPAMVKGITGVDSAREFLLNTY